MDTSLTFDKSFSIEQFKRDQKCTSIDIIRNPNTKKLFFIADNGTQGMVSTKVNLDTDDLQVTQCSIGEDQVWMICKKHTDNVLKSL